MIGKDVKETAAMVVVGLLILTAIVAVPIAAIRAIVAWLIHS